MTRALLTLLALLAIAAPVSADIVLEVQQSLAPPWQRGDQFSVVVTVRNLDTASVVVEFAQMPRGPVAIFAEPFLTELSSTCAAGTFGLINHPPIASRSLGSIAPGGTASCTMRYQVRADASAIAAEMLYFPMTSPFVTATPPWVVLPFGIAPAPASVPALSPWSALLLALAAMVAVSLRIRFGTDRRRRPAAATPTRRASA